MLQNFDYGILVRNSAFCGAPLHKVNHADKNIVLGEADDVRLNLSQEFGVFDRYADRIVAIVQLP